MGLEHGSSRRLCCPVPIVGRPEATSQGPSSPPPRIGSNGGGGASGAGRTVNRVAMTSHEHDFPPAVVEHLDRMRARLVAERLAPPDVIDALVDDALIDLGDVRVTDFVALLVERRVRERLRRAG